MNDETERVLNLIEATNERIVIHTEREDVIKYFVKLLHMERKGKKLKSVQKLAQLLDFFFDFRDLNNPKRSVKLQSIVTQIHDILFKEEEKKANN